MRIRRRLMKTLRLVAKVILGALLYGGVALAQSADGDCHGGFLDLPWRGLSCLHCLHQNSPQGPAPLVNVLKSSCLKRVMMAFIIDGSFGWNADAVREAIQSLSQNGREAWVHFYVYNGPAQRRWNTGLFHSFAIMHPATFLRRIKHDRVFQREYQEVVKTRLDPLVEYASSLGVRVSVAPGLEDTLDKAGYKKILSLTKKSLTNPESVTWARSLCYRCSTLTERSIPQGILREVHTSNATYSVYHGIVHTDGEYFRFSGDPEIPDAPAAPLLSDWRKLLSGTGDRGSAFLLWVWKYQDAPPGYIGRSPDSRTFRAPSSAESRELIEFLQSND